MPKKNVKGQISKRRLRLKKIKKITNGLFSTTTDFLLFSLYLPVASLGKKQTRSGVDQTFEEAYQMLEELNYRKIKRALYQLKKQDLIESVKKGLIDPKITAAGKGKLENFLPIYDEKRVWDKRLYLVNYDIQTKQNRLRDLLRESLRKIGAVKLQDSLYLCCYNPYVILKDFLKKYSLQSTVLVSELGQKGFLGKTDIQDFLWQQAGLEKINSGYKEFIEKYKQQKGIVSKMQVSLEYYSLLRDDSQLPFELLKEEYLGDTAYLLFLKLTSS